MRNTKKVLLALPIAAGLALLGPAVAGAAGERAASSARLSGAAEVPAPGDPDGRGVATVRIDTGDDTGDDTVCVRITVRKIDTAMMAHIHEAPEGVAGPVVVSLDPPSRAGFSRTCVEADSDLASDIAESPEDYYVNVHNEAYPSGAVRGQLR